MFKKALFAALALVFSFSMISCKERYEVTENCKPVLFRNGVMTDHLNIVFVPSGYEGDFEKFRGDVVRASEGLQNDVPFKGNDIPLNVFWVQKEDRDDNSFCELGCGGIDRMICCSNIKAKKLARECGTTDTKVVVIVNDDRYGGTAFNGYAYITRHSSAPRTLTHELGHSFIGLGDEYPYGNATERSPNCDPSQSCDRWKDLIDAGFADAECASGYCKEGGFQTNGDTAMSFSGYPFRAVNERLACCAYQNVTGTYPPFCDRFINAGVGLNAFCDDHQKSTMAFVEHPYAVELEKNEAGEWIVSGESSLSPMYYPRNLVDGEGLGDTVVEFEDKGRVTKEIRFFSTGDSEVFHLNGEISRVQAALEKKTMRLILSLEGPGFVEGRSLRVNRRSVRRWSGPQE